MTPMVIERLEWTHESRLGVWHAFVDAELLTSDPQLAQVLEMAHPKDQEQCARMRTGGPLCLMLRVVAREIAALDLEVEVEDVRRRRASCTGCGGPHGRPEYVGPSGSMCRCISVSHSGSLGAIAVADHPVGIDVQRVRPAAGLLSMDRRLHTNERRAARIGGPLGYARAVTQIWVRKEAYGKAHGSGLCRRLATDDLSSWAGVINALGCDVEAPSTHLAAVAALPQDPVPQIGVSR